MIKNHHIFGIILLLAAMLLVACSHRNDPTDPLTTEKNEIALKTGVARLLKKAAGIDNNGVLQTKALKIDAYYHNSDAKYLDGKKLHYTGGDPVWQFWSNGEPGSQEHYYWPILGSDYIPAEGDPISVPSLDFVGFCPFDAPDYISDLDYDPTDGVSFDCDMSSYMTLARQNGDEASSIPAIPEFQEYVVAVLNEQTLTTQTAAGGALPLQFKHPLAQIKFVITAASGTNVQIDSISIPGLYTSGTCAYNGSTMSWSSLDGSTPIVLNNVNLKNGTATTETTPFFVIPNNYGSKYLTVKCTWNEWSNVTIRNYGTNVAFNWEPGYSYTYNLTVDKYGLKVDVTRFTEQW